MEFTEYLLQFVKPELLSLIPVIYLCGYIIKHITFINNRFILLINTCISLFLSFIWVIINSTFNSINDFLLLLFTALTQGVLISGCSTFINQIIKQFSEKESKKDGSS